MNKNLTSLSDKTKVKIDELESQLLVLADQIEQERKEATEEDSAILQELLDKKDILEQQVDDLRAELYDIASNKLDDQIGKQYTVKISGSQKIVTIVSTSESDPTNGHIAIDSPLAKALKGKSAPAVVDFETPGGVQKLQIISVD